MLLVARLQQQFPTENDPDLAILANQLGKDVHILRFELLVLLLQQINGSIQAIQRYMVANNLPIIYNIVLCPPPTQVTLASRNRLYPQDQTIEDHTREMTGIHVAIMQAKSIDILAILARARGEHDNLLLLENQALDTVNAEIGIANARDPLHATPDAIAVDDARLAAARVAYVAAMTATDALVALLV